MQPMDYAWKRYGYQEIFSDVDAKMEKTNSDTEVYDSVIRNSFDTTERKSWNI